MAVLEAFSLKHIVDFRKREGGGGGVEYLVVWALFPPPQGGGSVEKVAAVYLRFSLWDGAERGYAGPPGETGAVEMSGSEQPSWP